MNIEQGGIQNLESHPLRKILSNIYVYYAVMAVAGAIQIGKNLIYARLLGPEALGFYAFALLLSTFGMFFCSFGLYEGAMGLFPVLYGKGKEQDVRSLRNHAAGAITEFTIGVVVLAGFVALLNPFGNQNTGLVFFLGAIFAGSQLFFVFVLADMRCLIKTTSFGLFMLLRAILSLGFGVLAARAFGYRGILLSETLISLALSPIAIRFGTLHFRLVFGRLSKLKPVFRIGFPLMVNNLVTSMASQLDKFFIIAAFGTLVFGKYSFAMFLITGASMVQAIIYQHIGPSILHRIGRGIPPAQILKRVNRLVFCAILLLAAGWYPFSLAVKRLVPMYFPDYASATDLLKILYVGAGIIAVSHYEHFVVAIQKTEILLVLNFALVIITGAALWAGIRLKLSLLGIAWIFVSSRMAYLSSTMALAKWAVGIFNSRQVSIKSG
jgi:O-antigen/teichoic acid export membrane protein